MNPVKAVLVDDEQDSLTTLKLLLKKHCPQVEIAAAFSDAKKAVKEIPQLQPQLLFLDVQMPGMCGFELLGKLNGFTGSVIFVTAHADFALRAIKFSALDYLLKPVDKNELKAAVAKFSSLKPAAPDRHLVQQLTSNIDFMSQPTPRKLAVSTQEGIEILLLDEVHYLESDRNYTFIHCHGKLPLLVAKSLKEFEEVLPPAQFMRIHSSYIINLQKVQRYVRAEGGYAVMPDGREISVSRAHKESFLRFLKQ